MYSISLGINTFCFGLCARLWEYSCCSVAQLCPSLWDPMDCSMPDFPVVHWVFSDLCLLNRWCHPIVSFAVVPFSSCPRSFPTSGSFPMSWLFASGGQRIGASASVSVLPMDVQGWFPLGLTVLISSQESSPAPHFYSISCLVLSHLYDPNSHPYMTTEKPFSSVQSLSHVRFFVTPWTAAHQASLSITNSQSLPKLMSTESVMPSNHLILCLPFSSCPQSFLASGSFPMSQLFESGGQSIGASASASALPMNVQGWFPLGLTGLISWLSKGFSSIFSSTTVWTQNLP